MVGVPSSLARSPAGAWYQPNNSSGRSTGNGIADSRPCCCLACHGEFVTSARRSLVYRSVVNARRGVTRPSRPLSCENSAMWNCSGVQRTLNACATMECTLSNQQSSSVPQTSPTRAVRCTGGGSLWQGPVALMAILSVIGKTSPELDNGLGH